MPRRTYTHEFKVSAVKLVNEQGYSVREAARSLGVDRANVDLWVKRYAGEAGGDGCGGPAAPAGEGALKAEIQRLRKENARLRMEREILKKAAAYFAKEQQP